MLNLSRPDHDRWWSLPNFVFATYTLFLAGFYFVPNAVDQYKFYIAAVFIPSLFLLPKSLRLVRGSLIWLSLLAYLGYMLLSSLWSENFSLSMLWRDVRYTAYILSFILLTLYFFSRNRQLPNAIIELVGLVAILAAAISIITFPDITLLPTLTENRLVGLGTTDNPNPSAFIYGFFGLVALEYARRHWGEALAYVYAAGVVVIAVFVILTQSNTSLLALVASCALLFMLDSHRARPGMLIGLVLGLATAIYLAWSLGVLSTAMDAGFEHRISIWEHVLEQWRSAPLFGLGYQQTLLLTPRGESSIMNYAHSLFLSTMRDGGLVGLMLLLLMYGLALRTALKIAFTQRRALYLCLFTFGLLCTLVDTDQIVTRPRELWIILWLPLSCLVAYELGLVDAEPSAASLAQSGRSPKNIR